MNPAFLLGIAFNIAYWHKKYHSGTICKGVSNPHTSWKIEWQGILNDEPTCRCQRNPLIDVLVMDAAVVGALNQQVTGG